MMMIVDVEPEMGLYGVSIVLVKIAFLPLLIWIGIWDWWLAGAPQNSSSLGIWPFSGYNFHHLIVGLLLSFFSQPKNSTFLGFDRTIWMPQLLVAIFWLGIKFFFFSFGEIILSKKSFLYFDISSGVHFDISYSFSMIVKNMGLCYWVIFLWNFAELDQLLDDAPLPFIMQHAAKISGVRKRVSSLNAILKSIQRRIDNVDRLLSAGISHGIVAPFLF